MRSLHFALLLVALLCACSGPSVGRPPSPVDTPEAQRVDQFEHAGYTVTVYFTDPLLQVVSSDPGFTSRSPRSQAGALSDYLHRHAIYHFVVEGLDGVPVGQLVLEGNPEVTDSAAFYRVVGYRSSASEMEETMAERLSIRGTLFEHMAPFQTPEGQEAVGNGIAFFEGIFMRVMPYAEIKAAILPHVEQITA